MFGNIVADAGRSTASKTAAPSSLRLDAKSRVAWYMACGLHFSGLVRYSTSSQLLSAGMILNALGIFPTVYRRRTVAHLSVHLHHLLVHPLGDGGTVVAVGAHVVAAAAPALLLFDLLQDDVREGPLLACLGLHERGERGFVFG